MHLKKATLTRIFVVLPYLLKLFIYELFGVCVNEHSVTVNFSSSVIMKHKVTTEKAKSIKLSQIPNLSSKTHSL